MKVESLVLNYRDLTPAAGNRLSLTLITGATYSRGMYLKQIDLLRCSVIDNTNVARPVNQAELSIVSNQGSWISRPLTGTLDADTLYGNFGITIGGSGDNLPASLLLNDIYIPSTGTFSVNAEIYCPGIVATDTAYFNARILYQFEATESYFVAEFDLNK